MKRIITLLLALPLLAACAVTPSTERQQPLVAESTPAPSPTPTVTPEPTPEPTPAPIADETLGVRRWVDPETPPPLPDLTPQQQSIWGDCLDAYVEFWSDGPCAELAQQELQRLGFLESEVTERINVSSTNAILRYQRSRDLKPDGTIAEQTWYALASGKPARSEDLPPECLLAGVVLCVDQGAEKLRYMEDGAVVRTVDVRLGGFTKEPKKEIWRNHPTANGLFRVYNKHIDPPSENYGYGSMLYSVIFDPNMYVHYSPDFARNGHTTSSHGCVNVADKDTAIWLFETTPIDARVYIY